MKITIFKKLAGTLILSALLTACASSTFNAREHADIRKIAIASVPQPQISVDSAGIAAIADHLATELKRSP